MNRIREIRVRAGLSSEELGAKVGTSGVHIRRLETGQRKLTQRWIEQISEALGCSPASLIANVWQTESNEVEALTMDGYDSVRIAIAKRGLHTYRVTEEGTAIVQTGISPGDVVTVDQTEEAIASLRTGDIVLVETGGEHQSLVLRCFFAPKLLLTNRAGDNHVVTIDDPTLLLRIIGVVIRD